MSRDHRSNAAPKEFYQSLGVVSQKSQLEIDMPFFGETYAKSKHFFHLLMSDNGHIEDGVPQKSPEIDRSAL